MTPDLLQKQTYQGAEQNRCICFLLQIEFVVRKLVELLKEPIQNQYAQEFSSDTSLRWFCYQPRHSSKQQSVTCAKLHDI